MTKETPQLDALNAELVTLNKDLSAADRKKAMKHVSCTKVTLSNYMNGKGRNIEKAEKLVLFLRKLNEKRQEVINERPPAQ